MSGQIIGPIGVLPTAAATTTWNPADVATVTLSGGNLISASAATGYQGVRAIASHSTGKYYYEILVAGGSSQWLAGIANATASLINFPGADLNSVGWNVIDGKIWLNGSNPSGSPVATAVSTDTISIAVDLSGSLIWCRVNAGTWNNTGANPAGGTGGISFAGINAGPYFPDLTVITSGDGGTVNFGATSYAQAVPSGFGNW